MNIQLPQIISYPRSGSHWINCAIELYSNKRRQFIFAPRHGTISLLPADAPDEYLFRHAHGAKERPQRIAYLWRNPVDVVFSNLKARRAFESGKPLEPFIKGIVVGWHKSFTRWTQSPEVADVIVTYEAMRLTPSTEFKKLTDFLNLSWDEEKALNSLNYVTKERLTETKKLPAYFGPDLLTPAYAEKREIFRAEYSDWILELIDPGFELRGRGFFAR